MTIGADRKATAPSHAIKFLFAELADVLGFKFVTVLLSNKHNLIL